MPRIERLGILLGLVAVGLLVTPYLPLPSPVLTAPLPAGLGRISFTLTPARQVSLVVTLLACIVIDFLAHEDGHLAGAGLARTFPLWVLPALVTLAGFALIDRVPGGARQVMALVGTVVSLGLVVVAQPHTLDPGDRWFAPARLGLNALTYAVALAVFDLAQTLRVRALVAVPVTALTSMGLALALLHSAHASTRRTWGSALLIGLMMAQLAWVLGPGVLPPLATGFLLLVAFYSMTAIVQHHSWGRLEHRVVVELLVVAAAALAIVLRFGRG